MSIQSVPTEPVYRRTITKYTVVSQNVCVAVNVSVLERYGNQGF